MRFISFTLTLVMLVCFSCGKTNKENPNSSLTKFTSVTEVQSVKALRKDLSFLITGTGKIKAASEIKVFSETSGVIEYCEARDGQIAKKDEVLIKYPSLPALLKLERAKIKLHMAEVEFRSELIGYNHSTLRIPDSLLLRLRAKSGLTTAEIDIKEAQLEVDKTTIKSPISGILSDVKVQLGQTTKIGDELLTVYSQADLILEMKVLESDIGYIRKGLTAEINSLASLKSKEGIINDFNPRSNENGLVTVRLKIIDPEGLLPGMNASASIFVPYRKCIVLPKEAVVVHKGKPVVFTIEEGIAKWNFVTIGRENGAEIEIVDGIKEGQRVITTNNLQLAHDAPVKEAFDDIKTIGENSR